MKKEKKTPVIFRKYKEGDVIALFPTHPGTNDPMTCSSYQRLGQHSSADYFGTIGVTKPATPEEYESLRSELQNVVGYDLRVITRSNGNHYLDRLKAVR